MSKACVRACACGRRAKGFLGSGRACRRLSESAASPLRSALAPLPLTSHLPRGPPPHGQAPGGLPSPPPLSSCLFVPSPLSLILRRGDVPRASARPGRRPPRPRFAVTASFYLRGPQSAASFHSRGSLSHGDANLFKSFLR